MGQYQEYGQCKDSGIEWLGDIPEHWKTAGLTKYLKSLIDYRGKTPEKTKEGIFLVTAKNIKQGNIDYSLSQEYVDENSYEEIMRRGIPEYGDVLLTTEAPLGEVANVDNTNIALAQRVIKMQGKEGILNNYFIKYWIMGNLFQQHLHSLCTGSTALGIKASKLCLLRVVIPPLEEQKQIAHFLDYKTAQIDALVAKKETLLEKLSEKRSALITQAVTKGLDPTVPMKDSGIEWLGKIPEHWETCHLKRLAEISYGVGGEIDRTITEGINLLSLPNIKKDGEIFIDEVPKCVLDETEKKDLLLRKGDLLFNWRNGSSEHLGKTVYFDLDGEWTHVSFLLRLRFNLSIESRYFHYMLNGLRITGFFTSSKAGVNNTFNLNELRNLNVIYPPKNEQKLISSHIEYQTIELDHKISRIEQAIALLKEYRTALITNAVTGKIDVRDIKLPESNQHQPTAINKNGTNR